MIATMSELPAHLRRSLTWDQGKEMARHGRVRWFVYKIIS
jgi:IS30 family transposase